MPIAPEKPQNKAVINTQPQQTALRDTNFTYLENKQIRVGEPMGLLLTLTYPATVTFIGPRV